MQTANWCNLMACFLSMGAEDTIGGSSSTMVGRPQGATIDLQAIGAVVLLCLTFVVALRLDGRLYRIPTPALLLLLVPSLLVAKLKVGAAVAYFGFVALTLLHLVWLDGVGRIPFPGSEVLRDFFLYIGLIGLYVLVFSNLTWAALEKPAVAFFKVLTLIGLAFWVAAMATGSSYGVDDSYPTPRLQSLMTEPSNISHFLPAFFIYCFRQRWWAWAAICAVAILSTFSPTVYLTLIMTAALLWLLNAQPLRLLVLLSTSVATLALIVVNYATLVSTLGEAGQLGQSAARVLEGFSFIASDGQAGANSRAELIFGGADFMSTYSLWWSGAGFGTSAYIGEVFNDGLLFDSNTWSSLIMWFGVLAIPVWLFVQYFAVRKRDESFLYVLLVSLCVSNTLNSGGVWLQIFFATLICLKFKRDLSELRCVE